MTFLRHLEMDIVTQEEGQYVTIVNPKMETYAYVIVYIPRSLMVIFVHAHCMHILYDTP